MSDTERDARRWGRMEWFYYCHVAPLLAAAVFLDFRAFATVSLLYTTVVSAITAGATYGAKEKAAEAELAAGGSGG